MKRLFGLVLIVFVVTTACGSRLPSPQTAERVTARHFKKYGKKYKDSDFGKFKVEKIEISDIEELQKNLASAEGFAYLSSGGPVYRIRVTLRKKAFGWRYQQWENLGVR